MSITLDNQSIKCFSTDTSTLDNESFSSQVLEPSTDNCEEEWVAIRPFATDNCINLNDEIVNIVSISVEKEKVSILLQIVLTLIYLILLSEIRKLYPTFVKPYLEFASSTLKKLNKRESRIEGSEKIGNGSRT